MAQLLFSHCPVYDEFPLIDCIVGESVSFSNRPPTRIDTVAKRQTTGVRGPLPANNLDGSLLNTLCIELEVNEPDKRKARG